MHIAKYAVQTVRYKLYCVNRANDCARYDCTMQGVWRHLFYAHFTVHYASMKLYGIQDTLFKMCKLYLLQCRCHYTSCSQWCKLYGTNMADDNTWFIDMQCKTYFFQDGDFKLGFFLKILNKGNERSYL